MDEKSLLIQNYLKKTPENIGHKADIYFLKRSISCMEEPPTLIGLSHSLGFVDPIDMFVTIKEWGVEYVRVLRYYLAKLEDQLTLLMLKSPKHFTVISWYMNTTFGKGVSAITEEQRITMRQTNEVKEITVSTASGASATSRMIKENYMSMLKEFADESLTVDSADTPS
jgi:hypothetical protein